MAACVHGSFVAQVEVYRLFDGEPGATMPDAFAADVTVRCKQCGEKMRFAGVEVGVLTDRPTCSADGLTLRCPLFPESTGVGAGLLSFRNPRGW